MPDLLFKTRGMSDPQGKPRVYFCSHPDDFNLYFARVSEELLAKQNCAVWYSPGDATRELELELGQMQLFVMPVTTRLLTTPNRALDWEFPFAMSQHIPVLPLMQEEGLEELFNQKCGDLQFLDKNMRDSTAISYNEKLEKYLSSVLMGDELVVQVRSAFDAYIFLSYRKKDRKYAQELMRLIHKNDFCRDIAIWYDEFLTPGENFNQAIEEALQKSNLFALVVTPNLVNETNYVMNIEYPAAREWGKSIFPVKMLPTDEKKLKNSFKAIPKCIDAREEKKLTKSLLNSVKRLAIRPAQSNPEHNFFIGLAYLSGIDVEVDRDKALKLITGAAESGLVEAVKKLVDMYRAGTGVERNYRTAIHWQSKLADLFQAAYEQNPTEALGNALAYALWDLGDYLYELQELPKAKNAYNRFRQVSEELFQRGRFVTAQRNLAMSCNKLGYMCQLEGQLKEAGEYYQKSLELVSRLAKEIGEAREDLAWCYEELGAVCQAEGQFDRAREYYQMSLEFRSRLVEENGTVESRRSLSISYGKLGEVCHMEDQLTGAREYYQKCLELDVQIADETGMAEDIEGLSVDYNRLGDVCRDEGKLAKAREYYQKGLELREQLEKEAGTVMARRGLSVSYERLGDICWKESQLDMAESYYQKCLKLREQLEQETGTVMARRDLSVCYDKLGKTYEAEGRIDAAKEYYQMNIDLRSHLAEETGTPEALRDLSSSCNSLGDIYRLEGQLDKAREYYQKGVELRLRLAEKSNAVHIRRDLSASYEKLGSICEAEGQLDKAREYYQKCLKLDIQLAEETGTAAARQNLSISYNRMGDICPSEALMYYSKSLTLDAQLVKELGTVESYDDFAVSCYKIGVFDEKKPNLGFLRQAYNIWKKLSEMCPDSAAYAERRDIVKEILDSYEEA